MWFSQARLEELNGADLATAQRECMQRAISAHRRTSELRDVVQQLQIAYQDTFQRLRKMKAASP